MPDTNTIGFIAKIIDTVSPSWSMVVFLGLIGLLFPIATLIRNSQFVEAIIGYVKSHNDLVVTVQQIRDDQIRSNEERKQQNLSVNQRLDLLEDAVEKFTCQKDCPNRQKDKQ